MVLSGEKNYIIWCLKSHTTAVENFEEFETTLSDLQAVLSQHPGIDFFLIYSTETIIAQLTLVQQIVVHCNHPTEISTIETYLIPITITNRITNMKT